MIHTKRVTDVFSFGFEEPWADKTQHSQEKNPSQENSFPGSFSFFPSRQNSLMIGADGSDFEEPWVDKTQHSQDKNPSQENSFPGSFSCFQSRQNSLMIGADGSDSDSDSETLDPKCWCSGNTCQQKYLRQSKYPRIIEPSSKLMKYGINKKVQIRIPNELQPHIGYGSCKHTYRALVTLITYIQLKCGFKVKPELYQIFRAPSQEKYEHARRVIKGFGLDNDFYVSIWAPTFQCRFVTACGGIGRIQNCIRDFFACGEPPAENHMQEVEKQEVGDFKSECLRMQKILSDHTIINVRKMSLCTGILYEAIKNPIKI